MDGKFLLKHFRYAVLAIFLIAAIICPTPDPIGMCLFATPMLALYFIVWRWRSWCIRTGGRRRGRREERCTLYVVRCKFAGCGVASAQVHGVSGAAVLKLTQQYIDAAPKRYVGSPGHLAAENFIKTTSSRRRRRATSSPTSL